MCEIASKACHTKTVTQTTEPFCFTATHGFAGGVESLRECLTEAVTI